MPQHPKKPARAAAHHPVKEHKKPAPTMASFEKAGEKVLIMGNKNMENCMHAADTYNQLACQMITACCDNFNALAEFSGKAGCVLQDFGGEMTESFSRGLPDFPGIAQEAFSCRNLEDIIRLQSKLLREAWDSYFNAAGRLYGIVFDTIHEAMEPVHSPALASAHAQRAMAA